jgi:hypothetical protein
LVCVTVAAVSLHAFDVVIVLVLVHFATSIDQTHQRHWMVEMWSTPEVISWSVSLVVRTKQEYRFYAKCLRQCQCVEYR